MIGLKTSRVVIVDNNPEEGLALLRAFSKYGIGASFYTGDPEELPAEKLTGVRLLALDMDIAGVGSGEAKEVLAPLINIIDKLVAESSAPFVILAWTNYPEYFNDFKEMFKKSRPDLRPAFFMAISKADVKDDNNPSDFSIEKIVQKLDMNSEKWFPFDLIMDWEQRVHDAATGTTFSLNKIMIEGSSTDLADNASRLFGALALASGGQAVYDKESALNTCFVS